VNVELSIPRIASETHSHNPLHRSGANASSTAATAAESRETPNIIATNVFTIEGDDNDEEGEDHHHDGGAHEDGHGHSQRAGARKMVTGTTISSSNNKKSGVGGLPFTRLPGSSMNVSKNTYNPIRGDDAANPDA
jgi:hypothetical protein